MERLIHKPITFYVIKLNLFFSLKLYYACDGLSLFRDITNFDVYMHTRICKFRLFALVESVKKVEIFTYVLIVMQRSYKFEKMNAE